LNQGKDFLNFSDAYTQEVSHEYSSLETTGIPGVISIVEAMTSDSSISTKAVVDNKNIDESQIKQKDDNKSDISKEQSKMKTYNEQLKKHQVELSSYENNIDTINGGKESSALEVTSSWINLMALIMLFAVIVSITSHAFLSKGTPVMDGFAVVAAIILLYFSVRQISSSITP
jgi:ATP-dependent Zn protease